jgi:glycosyltransferase involved in cell wall biosynthesis
MSHKTDTFTADESSAETYTTEAKRRKKPKVHVAMLGARLHYAVPKLLYKAGLLGRFYTDAFLSDRSWIKKILTSMPSGLLPKAAQRLLGRTDQDLPADRVVSFPGFGVWYWWRCRGARDTQKLNRLYAKAGKYFNRAVIRNGLPKGDLLFGYNGAVLELFRYAKDRGFQCILEQTLAPSNILQKLLKEEIELWPHWQPGAAVDTHGDILSQREREEWSLADLVLGGSPFVMEGIRDMGVSDKKCRLVHYGVSLGQFAPVDREEVRPSSKLRVLFAGEVGLRKGVPYLLEALRMLNSSKIEAKFVGTVELDPERLLPFRSVADFMGPVSRIRMTELYRWADLLVAPSICEGSALVTYEALASGIPVIATPNVGSRVQNGVDGMVVPIRDVEALAAAIECFAADREFLRVCSHNAVAGRDRLGLDAYQNRLVEVIREVMWNCNN